MLNSITQNGFKWAVHIISEFEGQGVCLVDGAYQVGNLRFYCIDDLVAHASWVLKH